MTRNVALVVLDTVRKDTFDEYAPRLRRRSGSSFEQARAASSWSTPSHTSMFTGDLPSEHGVHAEHFDSTFDFSDFDVDDTFYGDLPEHRRVGLSANSYINPHFGYDELFDSFHDFSIGSHTAESLFTEGKTVQEYMKRTDEPSAAKRHLGFLRECIEHDRPAKSVANGVWALLGPKLKQWDVPFPEFVDDGASVITDTTVEEAERGPEPTAFFLNYMDAHTPLRNLYQHDDGIHDVPNSWSSTEIDKWELNEDGLATDEYAENYRDVYRAAVDYLDRTVVDLIDRVQAATERETTFVIVSDHGHNLGYDADDGLWHHTGSMSEGVMHTPLEIVNPPKGYHETEDRLFSHLHLGDLLVDLANERPLDDTYFQDRIPAETVGLLGGDNRTWGREFSEETFAWWDRMMRVVYGEPSAESDRTAPVKRQWNSLGERFRYRLDRDRPSWQELAAEDVDVPAADRALFAEPLEEYKRAAAATEQDTDFDEDVEDHLKQLGYL